MTNAEAVNWLINITADIGKVEHQDLWHYEQALSEIREMLENMPTIEPKRMRGKWFRTEYQREEDIINGNYMFVCSNCSHVDFHAKTVEVPYCWYCGADMRGDSNG